MGCTDYFKEIVANFFNSEAEKWVEENFKIVSIDKIMKVQFSIQLSNFAYYGQWLDQMVESLEKDGKIDWDIMPAESAGSEVEKSSAVSLLKRFETFDYEVIRHEETASDAILIYGKEKAIDDVEGKTYAIVAVAGTVERQDLVQDLKISQVPFEDTEAFVHSGFYECFEALKPKIERFLDETLEKKPVDEILIVGHSLGGAVASLIGASLAPKFEEEDFRVVSVASPKIGNKAFQEFFKQRVKKHLRIRLTSDLIVDFPALLYWFRNSGEDLETTDFPIFDASEFAFGSHKSHDYLRGLEKNKEVILKIKFGNAVEKARKFVEAN
ncbi:Oidioi.mRNA.OKI2018_I69.chr1.g542.t1.cds [Oikopleura dioica]|uniref:Oidioi.mRNA.OKI2018_I69.chr1.g542.t1.cds n=1 Tax=Oikopleura dioica TaxID=34765 RepID=A0ABN7SPE6_OIKDI|nr:Oidioi.mRNA.OKI2018_I69.chr1.g542.t1.cds [Oikopleura dioica]